MKKIILIIFTFILIGCSEEDYEPSINHTLEVEILSNRFTSSSSNWKYAKYTATDTPSCSLCTDITDVFINALGKSNNGQEPNAYLYAYQKGDMKNGIAVLIFSTNNAFTRELLFGVTVVSGERYGMNSYIDYVIDMILDRIKNQPTQSYNGTMIINDKFEGTGRYFP